MRATALVLVTAGACSYPALPQLTGDAGVDADARPGDGPDGSVGPCDLAKPFGAKAPITELNTTMYTETGVRLSHDELTLYYWSTMNSTNDIFVSTRASLTAPWGSPTLLTNVSTTTAAEESPTITGDDLTIYYSSGGIGDIWSATRTSPTGTFGAGAALANVNTSAVDDTTPYVMPDNLTLYFATNAAGDFDLTVSKRGSTTGNFQAPTTATFAMVNTGGGGVERNPVVTIDGLTLYFVSTRAGGAGATDIYKATRTSTTAAFGAPTNVSELNTVDADYPEWISDDGCRLYVANNTSGNYDMFVATKPK